MVGRELQMIEWKIKGIFKADAQRVYEEITSIGETVTPEQIVEAAVDENTELHKCFEWRDSVAAHKYRLSQAQSIIRNISIEKKYKDEDGNDRKTVYRAIVCTNERKNTYETITRCIQNPESYARLREMFLRDLSIFKSRYERYSDIADEFDWLLEMISEVVRE